MVLGRIQQGMCKCNNLNCQQILTGRPCYYCPKGGGVQQHKNGFFYCAKCADQLARGAQVLQAKPAHVIQAKPAVVKSNPSYPAHRNKTGGPAVVKQGYMEKKGNWLNTAYKKRWFKLWSNKKMAYLTHPGASYTKGYCDFSKIAKMERKSKREFEVTTSERVWAFQCQNETECNEWFNMIQRVCTDVPVQQRRNPQIKQPAAPQPMQYVAAQPPPQGQVQYVQQPPPIRYDSGPYRPMQPQQVMPPQPVQYAMAPQGAQGQMQHNEWGQVQPVQQGQPMMNGNGNAVNGVYPNLANGPAASAPSGPSAPSAPTASSVQSADSAPQQPAASSFQPGMAGYGQGDMYGSNGNGNNSNPQWEENAPPAAFAPSAPPFEPSAPPMEEEGNVTQQ